MSDLFELKNALPMLIAQEAAAFDSKEYIYELKLDGIRCIAYLDRDSTQLRNKRNKNLNDIYPELLKIHEGINKKCILDGELIVLSDGKPDFFQLQRRSLMTNKMKIEQAGILIPVRFVAYDILYIDDRQITELPLFERKELLNSAFNETPALAISRYIYEYGIDFFKLAVEQNLEGVVAKRQSSKYYMDKRTNDWVKFKKKLDDDLIICGYTADKQDKIKSLTLGAYKNGVLLNQGTVAFGVSSDTEIIIKQFAKENPYSNPFNNDQENIVWIKPELVCTVEFMMRTETGHMRQSVFKGIRFDKKAEDCIL